jgi:hypothetical protein
MSIALPLPGMTSPYFEGVIGHTVPASTFPLGNLLIDDTRYDYEGNWAFCRFTGDEVLGARFGFGRGKVDLRDYGATHEPSSSFLMLHVELMLREGAVQWLATGNYDAHQLTVAADLHDNRLIDGDREIIRISGWPTMDWHMVSADGEAEVDVAIACKTVTILPDCLMPNNRFAMWLAIGAIHGSVRFRDRVLPVSGTAFYDHPRINVVSHAVPPVGWYLYTPMHFDDGSSLIAYFMKDGHGKQVEYYTFGLFIDPQGQASWLPEAEIIDLSFDADDKPAAWRASFHTDDLDITMQARVDACTVVKAWGNARVAHTRRENTNFPLVFNAEARIRRGLQDAIINGGGLAEYIAHA